MRSLRSFGLLCIALFLFAYSNTPARAQIGFAAGLNYESLSDLETSNAKATFDNASGYHAGIFYDLSIGTVGIRLGAFYRDLGEFEGEGLSVEGLEGEFRKIDLAMIDFPVDIRLNLSTTPLIQPYVLVGPVFSLPSSGDNVFDRSLESLLVSGTIGAGIALTIGGLRLFPELRYAIGISRLLKNEVEVAGFQLETDVQRVNSVMLRLGVVL